MVHKIIEVFKHWSMNLSADGILLKNFDQIAYKNSTLFKYFVKSLHEIARISIIPSFVLITDYFANDQIKKKLFDIYKVDLDAKEIYSELTNQSSTYLTQFKVYPDEKMKFIWSIKNLDNLPHLMQSRRSLLTTFYSMIYALPGQILIKQGEELEYGNASPNLIKLFRWNDLCLHSGFSNYTAHITWLSPDNNFKNKTFNKNSLLNDPGLDSQLAIEESYSFLNFIKFMNKRVKPKLNDLRPDDPVTTPLPIVPKGPQPFMHSYKSLTDSYLANDIFKLDLFNSCLKITRKIDIYSSKRKESSFYSIKLYRNMIFLFNFSSKNIFIDKILNLPKNSEHTFEQTSQTQLHIIFDSSKTLPEYIQMDSINDLEFYSLKTGHYLVVEF